MPQAQSYESIYVDDKADDYNFDMQASDSEKSEQQQQVVEEEEEK